MKTHTNAASGYTFKGANALILTQAMQAMGWHSPKWMTPAQAKASGKQPVPGAQPVQVVLGERPFKVYNLDQLAEAMQDVTPRGGAISNCQPEQTAEEVGLEEASEERRAAEYEERVGHIIDGDTENDLQAAEAEAWDTEQERRAYWEQHEDETGQRVFAANPNTWGLIIRPDYLKAAAVCASRKDGRAYLESVLVHLVYISGQPFVEYVATDGHRMVCLQHPALTECALQTWGHGGCEKGDFIVSLESIAKLPATPKKPAVELEKYLHLVQSDVNHTAATVEALDGTKMPVRLVDADYPDFARVLPRAVKGCAQVTVNGTYLADFAKVARLAGIGDDLTLHTGTDETAIVAVHARHADGARMYGALMPIRTKYESSPFRQVDAAE